MHKIPSFKLIAQRKILPAAVVPKVDHAIPLAKALLAGGLDIMEITFRNKDAPDAVRQVCEFVPEMTCGAGTLLTIADLDAAMTAGASFGLSPGFNPTMVKEAVSRGFPFIPGVQTAGEMEQSLELGCPWVKFFPAEASGGATFIKAVSAPYAHTPLQIIPLGGISPNNLKDYLDLPIVPAVGGSWLANAKLLNEGNFDQVTKHCRDALNLAL